MDCRAPDQGVGPRHVSQPLVSLVIPTLNAGARFGEVLSTLRSQRIPGGLEIVIIDSGSRDGTLELARAAGARILTIARRSFHHSRTRNQAIAETRAEMVVLTVQDALPKDDGWLARLIGPLAADPGVAGSYGLQSAPPTASFVTRTQSAAWCESHGEATIKSLADPHLFWVMTPEQRLELVRFDNVTSCLRRSVWESLPLPDYAYGEDMGWAKDALLAGHRLAFVPDAQVWHSHERGWRYELRRAYVDGLSRVLLVDWPSPSLSLREALTLLRRLFRTLATRQHDSVTDPDVARALLIEERRLCAPDLKLGVRLAQVYDSIYRFCLGLTNTAADHCAGGAFPEKAWTGLLRFATTVVVGQYLGSNAVEARKTPPFERSAWRVLDWLLNGNV